MTTTSSTTTHSTTTNSTTNSTAPLLEGRGLVKRFGKQVAVGPEPGGVSLRVLPGERVGLVGESGSGKSTLGRLLLRLEEPDAGAVLFDGVDITTHKGRALLPVRRQMQVVFQDPSSSLNPRLSVLDLVAEGLIIHGLHAGRGAQSRRERVLQLLHEVGLDDGVLSRRPHELSGGQKQRVGIARALAVEPRFLLLDEPVSALDVSVQAQIVNLLQALSTTRSPSSSGAASGAAGAGLAMLFVAHDLHVVRHLCERVLVMKDGTVVEEGVTSEVFAKPQHAYTQALLAAVPVPDPTRRSHRPPNVGGDGSGSRIP